MVAERQARYPKGTYKVLFARKGDIIEYSVLNLYTGRQSKPGTVWDLIKGIENDLSAGKYSQGSIQYRSWSASAEPKPARGKVVPMDGAKAAPPPEDCNPTFIIQVLYRQNATWQGTIQWLEGRQTRLYRSVNELLKLMDEAAELTERGFVGNTV